MIQIWIYYFPYKRDILTLNKSVLTIYRGVHITYFTVNFLTQVKAVWSHICGRKFGLWVWQPETRATAPSWTSPAPYLPSPSSSPKPDMNILERWVIFIGNLTEVWLWRKYYTVIIRLPDTRIPDSSEYRTPKLSGIQMVKNVHILDGPLA